MSRSLSCYGDLASISAKSADCSNSLLEIWPSGTQSSPQLRIVIVAKALCSTISGTREDAKSELSRLQISADRLQDYCRITRTRLPAVAAKRRGVSEHGIPINPVPPHRDLTKEEIEQAQAPWAAVASGSAEAPSSENSVSASDTAG